jgi:hypothetical protein
MKTELKYAILYVIAAFAWSCIEFLTGLQSTRIALHPYFVTPFYLLLTAIIYYLAIREKRARLAGRLSFGQGLATGGLLTVLILVLNAVAFYVFNTFVNPNFFADFARFKIETEHIEREVAEAYYSFNNLLLRGSTYRAVMGLIATGLFSWWLRTSEPQ